LDLQIDSHENASLVSVSGSVDALTAGDLNNFIKDQVAAGLCQIVVNLNLVEFMSSAGLRAILSSLKECRQNGGDLRLAAAQSGVEKVLKMSGFTSILKYYDSTQEALDSFSN